MPLVCFFLSFLFICFKNSTPVQGPTDFLQGKDPKDTKDTKFPPPSNPIPLEQKFQSLSLEKKIGFFIGLLILGFILGKLQAFDSS